MLRAESRSGSGRDHRVLARGGRPVGGVVSHGRVRRAGGYNMTAYTCRARSDFRISSRPPEALPARARARWPSTFIPPTADHRHRRRRTRHPAAADADDGPTRASRVPIQFHCHVRSHAQTRTHQPPPMSSGSFLLCKHFF